MFKRTGSFAAVDRVFCVDFNVQCPPGQHPVVEATMVYADGEGRTYGSCSWGENIPANRVGNLSTQSLDLLRQLLESMESDFGQVVFEHGVKEDVDAPTTNQDDSVDTGPLRGLGGS